MTLVRRALPLAALGGALALAAPGRAQSIIDEWASVQAPPAPKLESVTVDPKTTALLMLDFLKQNCAPSPRCMALLPNVQKLLAAARAKNMFVVYTKYPSSSPSFPSPVVGDILPQVAPAGKEPVVTAILDKFDRTNLDKLLRGKHIKTVIVVGNASNGAVMYTATAAYFHDYHVIVPVDGVSSRSAYNDQYAVYNFAAAPVMGGKVALTKTDMITIQ
jgi:nicotinamidase-related amidase